MSSKFDISRLKFEIVRNSSFYLDFDPTLVKTVRGVTYVTSFSMWNKLKVFHSTSYIMCFCFSSQVNYWQQHRRKILFPHLAIQGPASNCFF